MTGSGTLLGIGFVIGFRVVVIGFRDRIRVRIGFIMVRIRGNRNRVRRMCRTVILYAWRYFP